MTSPLPNQSLTIIEAEFTENAPEPPGPAEQADATPSARFLNSARSWLDTALKPWRWFTRQLKRIMPNRLFARSLILIVAPVVITQGVATYIFFERHWDTVTRRLSASVAGNIAMLIETYETYPAIRNIDELNRISWKNNGLSIALHKNDRLPNARNPAFFSILDKTLRRELESKLDKPFWFDTTNYPKDVDIRVQMGNDVLYIITSRKRVFATNGPIFVLWMVVASFVILSVAIIFLRNQVRPIQLLARAASSLGKGQEVADFTPAGATEVRRAAEAFIEMRDRIRRQIEQRTTLLAGVSHDLRTPLTRMKLQVALMDRNSEVEALKGDILEMEHMLEEYLAFTRGQGGEAAVLTDIGQLIRDIAENARRSGHAIGVDIRGDLRLPVRRNALKRCISNLVDNAVDFGDKVAVIGQRSEDFIEIMVDDNGPGIPEHLTQDAFKPFHRLDESRNLDRSGVGLGLSIALDVAHGHGGEILLVKSPWNGLRAIVKLPV